MVHKAERAARDLYWEVMGEDPRDISVVDKNVDRLTKALELNPYIAEPNTLLVSNR